MKNLRNLLFSGLIALTCSCLSPQKETIISEPPCIRKELVSGPHEVIANARKYSLPIQVLKKDNQIYGYYTGGITSEMSDKFGKIEFAYECSDNFRLLDGYFFGLRKPLKQGYTLEEYMGR
jgi:hypothetical protein